ncbi:hypothetical protein [Qaidamihabitans albus]|uniref:hypothetical protein n=1 Tax=Qaidamihabitans albus TaxID=2795733 RepID=UPI0018F239FA|nr:hypothetical protein [Qaidamihabitans albus]
MSIARRDDRHNADLVKEIAEGFNRAVNTGRSGTDDNDDNDNNDGTDGTDGQGGAAKEKPRFVVTGDSRVPERKNRRAE